MSLPNSELPSRKKEVSCAWVAAHSRAEKNKREQADALALAKVGTAVNHNTTSGAHMLSIAVPLGHAISEEKVTQLPCSVCAGRLVADRNEKKSGSMRVIRFEERSLWKCEW